MKPREVMNVFLDTSLLFLMLYFCFSSSVSSYYSSSCQLQGQFNLYEMHKPGDVILGGLFAIHFFSADPDLTFTSKPHLPTCYGFDVIGFRQAQTMAFATDEINRNSNLLPNVTLGYSLYDNCLLVGIGAALSLVSGQEEQVTLEENCVGTPPVLGIVGDSSSTSTIAISKVLSLYAVPMVSYFATCSCLSDRQKFPSFFRTIPSDAFQVNAMIQILKHFGWTWAGLLFSDDDYGVHAARSFHSDLGPAGGGCLAYTEILPWGDDSAELRRIVDVMRKSTARVVIVFAHESQVINLMKEVVRQNVTGLQWMASEAWSSVDVLQTPHLMPYLGGTLSIAIRRGEIPGLRDFLLQIRPDLHHNNFHGQSVTQFWEHTFQCRFAPPPAGWVEAGGELCTGQEVIENVETDFLDVSDLRPEYNVYKAVYALAYALDDMLQCEPGRGPFRNNTCAHLQRLEPWQLVHYLEKVNFTTAFGDQVSFDDNGDALPVYDIMNWVWLPDGKTKVQRVGEVKRSAFKGEELTLDEDKIFWNFESKQVTFTVFGLFSICLTHCTLYTYIYIDYIHIHIYVRE
ncbi:extracellular calcium-sensing receptor-like [Solea senegalensis]|uniref:Extracellular calcium-sensing receptor-like n=1 Tax=Solea senegalensis TaxID=28829 RepID=A0AAV6Q2F7_SOLSE|nr:extracellular calcium-sensing receptor-like [Solea senegalensis]